VSQEPAKYDARGIQVLEGWEAIRKRPGMYIGSTKERGLHQLVFEVAGLVVNEVLAGRATRADFTLLPGGGVRVADDGPGLPFEGAEGAGCAGSPGLEARLTQMNVHKGPGGSRYPVLDLCGVGPFVANALSSWMVAEVQREGIRRVQQYARGVAVAAPADAGPAVGSGTAISFWPDSDIFETTECSFDVLAQRFRELAFLNRDLDISLTDERRPSEPRSVRFRSPGGVREMVAYLDEQAAALVHPDPDIMCFERDDARIAGSMEVALRWRDSGRDLVRSYANSRPTPDGGPHVAGFHDAVEAAVSAYAREQGLLAAQSPDLATDRLSEGLTAVVSVKLEHPDFQGPIRGRLGNAEVRACVREAVQEHLGRWLEEHPKQAAAIIGRICAEAA
jgi:DNA gyrase subunit B